MRKFIKLHPIWSFLIVAAIWDIPQWLASVWSLFSTEPLAKFVSDRLHNAGMVMPHFSPYWITTPLALMMFAVLLYRVKGRPLPKSPPTIDQLEDKELREQASKWISNWLSDRKLCIQRAVLFGSVVYDHYATSDVDVIIVAEAMTNRKAARIGRKIKNEMRRDFNVRFGHPLHVQLFDATEKDRFEQFLSRLGKFEEVPLKGRQ